jgi:hypothetical protein
VSELLKYNGFRTTLSRGNSGRQTAASAAHDGNISLESPIFYIAINWHVFSHSYSRSMTADR